MKRLKQDYSDRDYHTPIGEREKPYAPLVPILQGNYRAARVDKVARAKSPIIRAGCESKTNGWHRGYASLNGVVVYRGPATRDRNAAMAFATEAMGFIRCGLEAH